MPRGRKAVKGKVSKKNKFKPHEGTYQGVGYESGCELMFLQWAFELIKNGYASSVKRSATFLLCDAVTNNYAVQLKKGSKTCTQTLSLGVSYTPDYVIMFTKKALDVFVWDKASLTKWDKKMMIGHKVGQEYETYVEVKPDYEASTTPKSVMAMKWMNQRHGKMVNMWKPNDQFKKTFVPHDALRTVTGYTRSFTFSPIPLAKFLTQKTTK